MTDCGCLSNRRELRRELSPPGRLACALARWRADSAGVGPVDDELSWILFGVGLDTLERIERGEVDPEPETAERIARTIGLTPEPHSGAPRPRRATVSPASIPAGNEGGAADFPLSDAAPLAFIPEDFGPLFRIPPPAPALVKGDDGTFHVEMLLGAHVMLEMTIEEAATLGAELQALAALTADPHLYERQPRLARPQTEEN